MFARYVLSLSCVLSPCRDSKLCSISAVFLLSIANKVDCALSLPHFYCYIMMVRYLLFLLLVLDMISRAAPILSRFYCHNVITHAWFLPPLFRWYWIRQTLFDTCCYVMTVDNAEILLHFYLYIISASHAIRN